jgi:hypothetical protein
MTKTIQLLSLPVLNKTEKNCHIQKPVNKTEPEDNMSIFLSLLDSMNALYRNLYKIDYLSKKNNYLCVAELTHSQEKQDKERGEKK